MQNFHVMYISKISLKKLNKMSIVLDNIVTNYSLAWDKDVINNTSQFLINLSSKAINELIEKRAKLSNYKINDYKELKKEIDVLKRELNDGFGFFIINGSCFTAFTKTEQKYIFTIISKILGELLVQNIKNEKLVEIINEGKSMKTGGRYHQTNEGGSYHTDSPQWKHVPDYIGLFCINPAKKGGSSKLLSSYAIHNEFLKDKKNLLKILYERFHFDKRGEYNKNESPTVFEPIFEYKNERLNFRYLRDYIDDGHKIKNQPLSNLQIEALDYLDEITKNENLILSYDLKKGDMIFFNNHRIVHGRTSFEDGEDENLKRCLIRVWIKEK